MAKYIVPVEFEITARDSEDAMQKMRDAIQAGIGALAPGMRLDMQKQNEVEIAALASAYYGEPYPEEELKA